MPLPSGKVIVAHPAVTEERDGNHKPSKTIDCPSNNTAEKTCVRLDIGAAGCGVASQNLDYSLHSLNPSTPVGYDNNVGPFGPPKYTWNRYHGP